MAMFWALPLLKIFPKMQNILSKKNEDINRLSFGFCHGNTTVTPHLDYENALLYGISQKHINKLPIAQNSAARLIER